MKTIIQANDHPQTGDDSTRVKSFTIEAENLEEEYALASISAGVLDVLDRSFLGRKTFTVPLDEQTPNLN